MSIHEAVFTPWAELLCIPCNNSTKHDAVRQIEVGEVDADLANTRCDRCEKPTYCDREDVVLCQRIVDAAQTIGGDDGSAITLWQTGGMCVAAGYSKGRYEMLLTEREDDFEVSEKMLIGVYELDEDDCPGDPIYLETATVRDAAARARVWEHWIDEATQA